MRGSREGCVKFGLLGVGSARVFGSWDSRDRRRSGSRQRGERLLILVKFFEDGQLVIQEVGVVLVLVPAPNEHVEEQGLRESSLLFLCAIDTKGQQLCLTQCQ